MLNKLTRIRPELSKILHNISWLLAERVLTIALSFVVGIYLIRYLGTENFGKLSYGLSFVALFEVIAKLGLDGIVIRNLVKEEQNTQEILGTAFLLKLIGSVFAIASTAYLILFLNHYQEIQKLIIIIAISLLFSSFDVIDFWYQSKVKSKAMSLVRSGQFILSSLAKILLITFLFPLISFAWLIVVDSFFKAIGFIFVYFQHHQSILSWRYNWSKAIQLLKDSLPLLFSSMMVSIYFKIDQVMLGNMAGNTILGNYAAAVRFSEIPYFIAIIICSTLFPSIVQAKESRQKNYYNKLQKLYDFLVWLALIIAILVMFISQPLIITLLGQDYQLASQILAYHIWSLPFVFLGLAGHQWLLAENLTRFAFITSCCGAITNILLNLWLIPIWGGIGAAIATVISYGVSSHITFLLYPVTFPNGWMLTKALFIPLRIQQNIIYLKSLKSFLWKLL